MSSQTVGLWCICDRAIEEASTPPCTDRVQLPVVERFVVVHGQIILNQFQNYPKEAVRRSAFATGLKEHMQVGRASGGR